MNASLRTLVVGALGLLVAAGVRADEWLPVRSEADGFAVLLPGVAVEEAETHWTLAGRVHSRIWETRGAGEYWVSVYRLPVLARTFVSEEGLLVRAGRDLAEDQGGTDVSGSPARLVGHPARALTWRSRDGRTGEARLVLVGDRLFVLAAVRSDAGAGLEPFFGSFEVW